MRRTLLFIVSMFASLAPVNAPTAAAQSFGMSRSSITKVGVMVSPLTSNSVELGVEARLGKNFSLGIGGNPSVWRPWDGNKFDRSGFGWNMHGKYFPWGESLFVGGRLTGNQIRYEGNVTSGGSALRRSEFGYYMHAQATVGWQTMFRSGFTLGSEVGIGPKLLTRRRSETGASGAGNLGAALTDPDAGLSGSDPVKAALEKHAAPLNLYVNLLSFGYMF